MVGGGKEELKLRLLDCSIQAVYQEYFTDDYFHMRNMGRAERGLLKDKAISIIGCGALGSETADALNKAGVGSILLVDKEDLRAHNVVRHTLGIDRTSFPKALGMAEQLVLHNPFVNIECNSSNILLAKLAAHLTVYDTSFQACNISSWVNVFRTGNLAIEHCMTSENSIVTGNQR